MKLRKVVKSSAIARKYERIGYEINYFTYLDGDFSTMTIHMVKKL